MKKPTTPKKSQTDLVRLDAMDDTDIDLSDSPEITPELFAKAVGRRGLKPVSRKSQLTRRLRRGDVTESSPPRPAKKMPSSA